MTGREGVGLHIPVAFNNTIAKRRGEGRGKEGASPLDHGFQFDCCLCTNECLKEGGPGFHTSSSAYIEEPCWIENRESV